MDRHQMEGHGQPAAIQERIRQIKARFEQAASPAEREPLQERLAKLEGHVARILVGADSNGILDPAKVVCSALQNAASVAAMILTTNTLITDQPEHVSV